MVGLLAATAAFIVAQPAAYAATIDPSAWYEIVSRHSGKVVDVCNHTLDNGACVQQYTRNGNANQQFRFLDSSGYYRIVAKHSSKCLDVTGASTDKQRQRHPVVVPHR